MKVSLRQILSLLCKLFHHGAVLFYQQLMKFSKKMVTVRSQCVYINMLKPRYKYLTESDLIPIFSNQIQMASFKLKVILFRLGIKDMKCEKCKMNKWLDQAMPLELHHIDGNHMNNNLSNLQILCPNCHSIEPNFCNKQKADLSIERIVKLAKESTTYQELFSKLGVKYGGQTFYKIKKILIQNQITLVEKEKKVTVKKERPIVSKRTQKEAWEAQQKIKWVSDKELEDMIWEFSMAQIGKKLGISDKAIAKRCKLRGIPVPPVGFFRKREVGQIEYCKKIENELRVLNRPKPTGKTFINTLL